MGISKEILAELTLKLAREMKPDRIYLFGSHAWGEPGKDSDIDLLIVMYDMDESRISAARRAGKAIRDFSKYPVDILVRTLEEFNKNSGISSTLMNKIMTSGKLLYARN